jgi:hypothetical protein
LLCSLALVCFPLPALALDGGAWTVGKGEWYSEFSASRLSANAYFLPDGRDAALPDGGRIQSRSLTSYNEIGWKPNVSFVLDLPFVSRTERTTGTVETTTGLSDLVMALRVRLRGGSPGLLFDFGWKAPLGYEKDLPPTLGNGRQEGFATFHAGLSVPWIAGFAQVSRGFRFISEDNVLMTTSSADVAGWVGERVRIGARYEDFYSFSSSSAIAASSRGYAVGPVVILDVDDHIALNLGGLHQWAGRNETCDESVYVAVSFKQSKLNRLQGFLGTSKRP